MSKTRSPKFNKKQPLQREETNALPQQESQIYAPEPASVTPQQTPVKEAPPPMSPSVSPPIAREQERLGDILRRVREHRGELIIDIATYLCIRSGYLIALEESRYESLPADAYVIGFLKSYASYLELDEKGAVDQYRREMAGRRRKPQLSMPQPLSEGRAPTVALIVGSLLAALIVYGVWYGLWAPDRNITNAPPPLSTIEVEGLEKKEASPQGEEATLEGSSVFLETASIPKESEIDTIIIEAEPAQEKEEKAPIEASAKAPIETPIEAPIETPIEAPKKAPIEEAKPNVYGTTEGFHVTLNAEKECWILITDEKGLTVFDQTLKPGESYNVPTKKGLRLTTGNPSGINVILNGAVMPKIKSKGRVARGVPLDPTMLKDFLTENNEE